MSKEKDCLPNTLGDLHLIERLPAMQADDKRGRKKMRIHWGEDYQRWGTEKKLQFAEDLASSMNNAAEVLQKERQAMIDLANAQEALLKDWSKRYASLQDLMTSLTLKSNEEKQSRLQEMQELKSDLRAAMKRIKELEDE